MRVSDFALGLVVRGVLGRLARPPKRKPPRARSRSKGSAAGRRSPLLLATLSCFALGLPLMVIFEHTITRILGVGLMFAFIVSGVFLVADPAFLDGEEDER
jgi:hypothetical protein